jgi:hypothetical protein
MTAGDAGPGPGRSASSPWRAIPTTPGLQQPTGDFPAAASHQRALALFSDLSSLLGQAEAHNLGQLAIRAASAPQAPRHGRWLCP